MEVETTGENPSPTGEFVGKTHKVLECTQTHPPGNQNQKDPICFWAVAEVTESLQRAEQVVLFPLQPFPNIQHHNAAKMVALLRRISKAPHLTTHRHLRPKKKKKAQMTEQVKAPEKIQLSNKEITNLSEAQLKTPVIRMFTELVEYGCKIDEKVRAMKSEITKCTRNQE